MGSASNSTWVVKKSQPALVFSTRRSTSWSRSGIVMFPRATSARSRAADRRIWFASMTVGPGYRTRLLIPPTKTKLRKPYESSESRTQARNAAADGAWATTVLMIGSTARSFPRRRANSRGSTFRKNGSPAWFSSRTWGRLSPSIVGNEATVCRTRSTSERTAFSLDRRLGGTISRTTGVETRRSRNGRMRPRDGHVVLLERSPLGDGGGGLALAQNENHNVSRPSLLLEAKGWASGSG